MTGKNIFLIKKTYPAHDGVIFIQKWNKINKSILGQNITKNLKKCQSCYNFKNEKIMDDLFLQF